MQSFLPQMQPTNLNIFVCSDFGLDLVSAYHGLGLDLVSTPQSLAFVSVSILSGLGHDFLTTQTEVDSFTLQAH